MRRAVGVVLGLVAAIGGLALLPSASAQTTSQVVKAVDVDLVDGGAWVTWSNGRVSARVLGDGPVARPPELSSEVFALKGESAVALVPTTGGYWLFTSNGRVITGGDAATRGDLAAFMLNAPIVAAAPTVSGDGYYMLSADGGVFAFGGAQFYGSVQGVVDEAIGTGARAADHLTAPIVTLATTPAGYWLVAEDGAVFPFGDAPYHGSFQDILNTGNQLAGLTREWTVTPPIAEGAMLAREVLAAPIVDVVPSTAGDGYLMLASDGGIFNFGQSQFHGALAGRSDSPAVASDVTSTRDGYVIVTADGFVHGFGSLSDQNPPGKGVNVRLAARESFAGYFRVELYKLMLEELGYTVTDMSDDDFGSDDAYREMVAGELDFWISSTDSSTNSWLESEVGEELIGDHVSVVGTSVPAYTANGFLIEKTFADRHGIKTLDDLNRNAAAIAEYDASDVQPGNGIAEIFGCQVGVRCHDVIDAQIAFSRWENIAQVKELSAFINYRYSQVLLNLEHGVPFVIFMYSISSQFDKFVHLIPGQNVYWLAVERVLADGRSYYRLPGTAKISREQCPAAGDHHDGLCALGSLENRGWYWDLVVTAGDEFLEGNPAAKQLLMDVTLSHGDYARGLLGAHLGVDPKLLATQWVADNRSTVDGWLNAARTAR